MWGSSFADLAKKAAELQEQAASSIAVSIFKKERLEGVFLFLFLMYMFSHPLFIVLRRPRQPLSRR